MDDDEVVARADVVRCAKTFRSCIVCVLEHPKRFIRSRLCQPYCPIIWSTGEDLCGIKESCSVAAQCRGRLLPLLDPPPPLLDAAPPLDSGTGTAVVDGKSSTCDGSMAVTGTTPAATAQRALGPPSEASGVDGRRQPRGEAPQRRNHLQNQ